MITTEKEREIKQRKRAEVAIVPPSIRLGEGKGGGNQLKKEKKHTPSR